MKLKDLGDLGNILAALGVIVSLMFLAWQISKNTAALHAEANLTMNDLANATFVWIQNPQFAEVLLRSSEDPESLDAVESLQLTTYMAQFFSTWEQGYVLHTQGLMTDDQWAEWDNGMFLGGATQEGARRAWTKLTPLYPEGFRDHVNALYARGSLVAD